MRCAIPGPGGVSAPLLAGTARVALPLTPGVSLMGYALRQGGARGVLDPLFARAVYLRGASDVLLVSLDLCLVAPSQAAEVRTRIAARTAVPVDRICVACIHTHSGPDTGLGALVAGGAAPPHVASLLEAAVEAGARAVASAVPARVGHGTTRLAIGRNRRCEDGPVDRAARIVRIDRRDGAPLAVIWLHGCHPTVLGHDNLAISADWPGAANAAIEIALPGALAVFVLSAHADIDPRTRGLQDLARASRSLGESAEVMRSIGREAGAAIGTAACAIRANESDTRIGAASARVALAVHGGADEGAAAEQLAERRRDALAALEIDPDTRVRTQELMRRADALAVTLPAREARERIARVRLYLRDRAAPVFAGGRVAQVEVQALHIGAAHWLALPLEPTVRVGLDWARRQGSEAAVVSIANGWLRYLPHAQDFAEPGAHRGYEILSSTFEPQAATALLEAGEGLHAG